MLYLILKISLKELKSQLVKNILTWIDEIWSSDNYLKKETIINGFHKSGISLALYGSEDNEFTFNLNNMDDISNDEMIDDNNLGQ